MVSLADRSSQIISFIPPSGTAKFLVSFCVSHRMTPSRMRREPMRSGPPRNNVPLLPLNIPPRQNVCARSGLDSPPGPTTSRQSLPVSFTDSYTREVSAASVGITRPLRALLRRLFLTGAHSLSLIRQVDLPEGRDSRPNGHITHGGIRARWDVFPPPFPHFSSGPVCPNSIPELFAAPALFIRDNFPLLPKWSNCPADRS